MIVLLFGASIPGGDGTIFVIIIKFVLKCYGNFFFFNLGDVTLLPRTGISLPKNAFFFFFFFFSPSLLCFPLKDMGGAAGGVKSHLCLKTNSLKNVGSE